MNIFSTEWSFFKVCPGLFYTTNKPRGAASGKIFSDLNQKFGLLNTIFKVIAKLMGAATYVTDFIRERKLQLEGLS